jgi:O-antigen ligase
MASICLVAMLMTASRAGIVLSLMCIAIAVLLAVRPAVAGRRIGLVELVAGIIILGVLAIVLGGAVANRFALQGLSDGGRTEIYAATLGVIKDNWLVGTGLGTFRWGFSPYRPSDIPVWGVWDRAHNTVLEIAAEMGVPLASVVLLGAFLILAVLVRGVLIRRRDRAMCIAGLAVALLSFSHALIDFSLQIPGYAITAFSIIGAGLAQSFRPLNGPAGP